MFTGTILLLAITEKIFKMQIFKSAEPECPNCKQSTKTEDLHVYEHRAADTAGTSARTTYGNHR